MKCAPLAAALLLVATGAAAIEPSPGVPLAKPLQLRLKGRFAPDRATARRGAADAITVQLGSRRRWFAVDEARTTGPDTAVSGRDVLAALAPVEPTLRPVGPPDLRRPLDDARDGARVDMEGIVDRGAHTYLLRNVTVEAAAP